MRTLADHPTTLMFHAEMIPPIADSVGDAVTASDPPLAPTGELTSYNTFLESRPPAFETYAVDEIISLAPLAPHLHLHIVHLSATECIPILREARRKGINITAETCFHYLGLAAEDVEDGDTRHKCCPPIRSQINQDGLWAELCATGGGGDNNNNNNNNDFQDSVIKTIVSDHSPCTPELKLLPQHLQREHARVDDIRGASGALIHSDSGIDVTMPGEKGQKPNTASGDFFAAWGGISSVGLGLPILHTTARERASLSSSSAAETVLDIVDIVRLCSQATSKQVGLSHRKGGLKVGLDADLCVFDDAEQWTLECQGMHWKNRCSPWEGKKFTGRVRETWLRGSKVYEFGGANDGFVTGKPVGEAITEKRTA